MGFAGITKNQGRDFNYFQKVNVNWSNFGGGATDNIGPDLCITFSTTGVMFLNEGSGTVEYSFNGNIVHGELNSNNLTQGISFDNRVISLIWFRCKIGSSGPITVSVHAWKAT